MNNISVAKLTLQAFLIPIQKFRAVLKIFWPLFIIFLALIALQLSLGLQTIAEKAYIFWAGQILGLLILLLFIPSGLLRWYRCLVLSEPATTLRLIPKLIELRFIGIYILVAFVFYLIFTLVSSLLFYTQLFSIFLTFWGPPLFVISVPALVFLIAYFLFPRLFLLLPKFAAEDKTNKNTDVKFSLSKYGITLPVSLFIASLFPFILYVVGGFLFEFIYLHFLTKETLSNISSQTFNLLIGIMLILIYIIVLHSVLMFASVLSIYYREKIRPLILSEAKDTPTSS